VVCTWAVAFDFTNEAVDQRAPPRSAAKASVEAAVSVSKILRCMISSFLVSHPRCAAADQTWRTAVTQRFQIVGNGFRLKQGLRNLISRSHVSGPNHTAQPGADHRAELGGLSRAGRR
jgi:hypothetical protein